MVEKTTKIKIDKQYTIGFVGDGTNDLEAMREANFSLKLGHTQLSSSTSFVSDSEKLSVLIPLINEAKCSLQNGYHNMGIMIFFLFVEFFAFYVLILEDLLPNSKQAFFMDFALLNLFGLCIPQIKPLTRLVPQRPQNTLWYMELWVFIIPLVLCAYSLMLFGFELLKNSEFYVPIKKIVVMDDIVSGKFNPSRYKFFDNHHFFILASFFFLVFIAVHNRKDNFRKGFFDSRIRTGLLLSYVVFVILLQLLPIMKVRGNFVFSWLVYTFRIRLIYGDIDFWWNAFLLCSPFAVFYGVAVIFKVLSKSIRQRKDKIRFDFETLNRRILKKIDSRRKN